MSHATLYRGDAIDVLRTLPEGSCRCCVTSPPYWGLRDYGQEGQLGLETTPDEYVAKMVEVFREVRRVLADDATVWLNLGDSYAAGGKGGGGSYMEERSGGAWEPQSKLRGWRSPPDGLKQKDLVGIPWVVAFALRTDGWYLRSDIIWSKPNPMPESVTDRPTKAHEYVFLLSKSSRYFYDADAVRTDSKTPDLHTKTPSGWDTGNGSHKGLTGRYKTDKQRGHGRRHAGFNDRWDGMSKAEQQAMGANARTVWNIPTVPYPGSHFATFPPELAKRCIAAGSAPGDTVLDPFGGSGTTASVATGMGRDAIHIDLGYHDLAVDRIGPLMCTVK